MKLIKLWVVSVLLVAGLASSAHAQSGLKVEQAWARPTVQGQSGGGGFLRIVGGKVDDKLLSASSPAVPRVEIHTMKMEGDVMRMRQIDSLAVPAGKTVELSPGGNHIMFMGLTSPLQNGSTFPLTLRFEKAGEVKVNVLVQPRPAGTAAAGAKPAANEHKHHKH